MKVVFALRADAIVKPGGDTKKIDSIRAGLAKHAGVESEIVYEPAQLQAAKADVVHSVNLDLPLENLRYAWEAARTGTPFVLSTVHHPWKGIEAAYSGSADRYFVPMRRLGLSAPRAVFLREWAKLAARRDASSVWSVVPYRASAKTAQQQLLAQCATVLPMCQSEKDGLDADLGPQDKSVVVPNGATFEQTKGNSGLLRQNCIVVGRVEPRKNSLEMARAAHGASMRTVFAGALNEKHGAYVREFLRLASTSPFIEYVGVLPRSELRAHLMQTDLYVNPSWYEVVSQADIEAASSGCRIATTKYSYVKDFLPDAMTIDPLDIASIDGSDKLEAVWAEARASEVSGRESWEEVAGRLVSCYEMVTS